MYKLNQIKYVFFQQGNPNGGWNTYMSTHTIQVVHHELKENYDCPGRDLQINTLLSWLSLLCFYWSIKHRRPSNHNSVRNYFKQVLKILTNTNARLKLASYDSHWGLLGFSVSNFPLSYSHIWLVICGHSPSSSLWNSIYPSLVTPLFLTRFDWNPRKLTSGVLF